MVMKTSSLTKLLFLFFKVSVSYDKKEIFKSYLYMSYPSYTEFGSNFSENI